MAGREWQRLMAVTACASLVSAIACRGGNGANDSATTSAGEVARSDSAATATTPSMATTPTSASVSGSAMAITGGDPEILNVLAVVDQDEMQDGQLAQRQARNARVKSFGRELVQAHTKSLQKDRQLAKTANIQLMNMNTSGKDSARKRADTSNSANAGTANSGGVAAQLHQMHTQAMEQLRSRKGADFDSAFVNAQVMGHQQVLDLLQRSQNQAQNSNVQSHVADAVKEVQSHLDRAKELQQSLMSGGTGTTGDSTSKTRSDTARKG